MVFTNICKIKKKLRQTLSKERYNHSLNVMASSILLAKRYNLNTKKAAIAGLLHDCAKDLSDDELINLSNKFGINVDPVSKVQCKLLHAPVGARIARLEYGITDKRILRAICWHTTGNLNMGLMDKVIFMADCIERDRTFDQVEEIRKLSFIDINQAMLKCLDYMIGYVIQKKQLIHLDTIHARNDFLRKCIGVLK